MQRTFGERAYPCVPALRAPSFYDLQTDPCSPLSGYDPYSYVFAPHDLTTFHVSGKTGRGMLFGNYPIPLRIHRHLIACDRTEKMFANPTDERTENYVTGRFG